MTVGRLPYGRIHYAERHPSGDFIAEILGSSFDIELNRKIRDYHWLLKVYSESKGTCSSRNVVYICVC